MQAMHHCPNRSSADHDTTVAGLSRVRAGVLSHALLVLKTGIMLAKDTPTQALSMVSDPMTCMPLLCMLAAPGISCE